MSELRLVQEMGDDWQDSDAARLHRYAIEHREDGFTYVDIDAKFGWDRNYFYRVARRLRETLSDQAETLICTPDVARGPWTYRLTSDTEATKIWHRNRLDDCETRLDTIVNVASSAMKANGARTRDGRRARILHRTANRAIEDLAELRENSA